MKRSKVKAMAWCHAAMIKPMLWTIDGKCFETVHSVYATQSEKDRERCTNMVFNQSYLCFEIKCMHRLMSCFAGIFTMRYGSTYTSIDTKLCPYTKWPKLFVLYCPMQFLVFIFWTKFHSQLVQWLLAPFFNGTILVLGRRHNNWHIARNYCQWIYRCQSWNELQWLVCNPWRDFCHTQRITALW